MAEPFRPPAWATPDKDEGFQPPAYATADVEPAPAPRPQEQISEGVSGVRGALQGVLSDYADEALGAISAVPDFIGGENWGDAYRRNRDEYRDLYKQSRDQNFKSYTAGQIGGGIVQSAALNKAGLLKAPSALGELAKQSALMGAVSGLGASEADLTRGEVGGALLDAGVGGVVGGTVGYVVPRAGQALGAGLQKAGNALPGALKQFAAERALKAAGYINKDLKPVFRQRGRARIQEMGQGLLESGAIRAGRTVEDVADRLQEPLDQAGREIGAVLSKADATGELFDMAPFVARVREKYAEKAHDPIIQGFYKRSVAPLLKEYEQSAVKKGGLTFSEAEGLKRSLQDIVNFGNSFNDAAPQLSTNNVVKELQSELLDEVEQQVGRALGPEDLARFQGAKNRWGIFIDALDKAKMGEARGLGSSPIGLRDLMAGGAAAAAGTGGLDSALGAVAAPFALKVLRDRGDSTLAAGASALARSAVPKALFGGAELLADGASRMAPTLARSSPALPAAQEFARSATGMPDERERTFLRQLPALVTANPQALGRYGALMQQQAREAGQDGVLALDAALADTDPQYRALRQALIERAQAAAAP